MHHEARDYSIRNVIPRASGRRRLAASLASLIRSELLPTTRLILSGNGPDSRQLDISPMDRLFLFIVFLAAIVWIEVADEDPHWRVAFYQNLNAGGLKTKLDVSPDGTSSVPISEFRKYHLEDQISEIRYTLPPGVFLVCFAGRFFRKDNGDIGNFINNNKILRDAAGQDGIKMSNDVLSLEGSGSEQIVNLQPLGWANRIRSAEVIKP
jgi:hypothetical protein